MLRRGIVLGLVVMAVVVVALALLSSMLDGRRADALTPAHTGAERAALRVLGDGVEVRPAGSDGWVAATDANGVVAGDAVRVAAADPDDPSAATDVAVEVLYLDGSRTRLGAGAELVVERLEGDALAPLVRVSVAGGRSWHRVQRVTGERGAYEVETASGSLSARRGGFEVACEEGGDGCVVAVVEGLVVAIGEDGGAVVVEDDERVDLAALAADDAVEQRPAGALAIQPFASANLDRDRATGRFGPADEACAVTVNGRNADLADGPATAIRASVGERLVVDALAVGPLEGYDVRLGIGLVDVPAARGRVAPGEDVSRFRGTVSVGDQARWGVGLYAVTATTAGTTCRVTTWVDVRGGSPVAPLLTVPGALAVVLGVGAVTLLALAVGPVRGPLREVTRRRGSGTAPLS